MPTAPDNHDAHDAHDYAERIRADGSYNQSQMQDLINKVDELINALRR